MIWCVGPRVGPLVLLPVLCPIRRLPDTLECEPHRAKVDLAATPKPVTGIFPNTMAYARWGNGAKTLLLIPGGPGNYIPTRQTLKMILRPFRPLVEDGYSLWMVTRRRGMPQGHTIENMAADYADLIATEFDGKVDLVVGVSLGGMIGQYLAANHPDRFDHIAVASAPPTVSEPSRLDYDGVAALSQGDRTRAGRLMAEEMLSDSWLRWTAPALGTVLGLMVPSQVHDEFASDIWVEAEAAWACDARPILPHIKVPVLLTSGDKELAFPLPLIEETARLIPDCTLKLYEGKDHSGAIRNRRLAPDILDFVNRKRTAAT